MELVKFFRFALMLQAFSFFDTRKVSDIDVDRETIRGCYTKDCVLTTSRMLTWINESADPCDNFYKFACGNFLKTADNGTNTFSMLDHDIKQQLKSELRKEITSEDQRPFRLMKSFYANCIGQTAKSVSQSVNSIVNKLGGWPVNEGSRWNESKFDWLKAQCILATLCMPTNPFLSVSVSIDLKNSSRNLIWIENARFHVIRHLLVAGWKSEYVQRYFALSIKLAIEHGASEDIVYDEIMESMNLLIDLAKISLHDDNLYEVEKSYEVVSLGELSNRYKYVPWFNYIEKVLYIKRGELNDQTQVALVSKEYFENLEFVINKYSKRVQANYVLTSVVVDIYLLLLDLINVNSKTKDDSDYLDDKDDDVIDYERLLTTCVDATVRRFSHATGALYVRKLFDLKSIDTVSQMSQEIIVSVVNMLNSSDWLPQKPKKAALEKINEMVFRIGFPQVLLNDTALNEYYSEVQVPLKQNFLNFTLDMLRFNTQKMTQRLKMANNKTEWRFLDRPVTHVEASYASVTNTVNLLAGILQGVFYNRDRPNYMNYGTLGFIIAHEIMHGFDTDGRHHDQHGNINDWWDKSTNDSFNEKAQCLIDQYDAYIQGRGIPTLSENIADTAGLKVAYLTYRRVTKDEKPLPGLNYTPNQLFWISMAQSWCSKHIDWKLEEDWKHAPPQFRVIGSLSNNRNFPKDFNCPLNSPMNPEKKCIVWVYRTP